MEKGEREELERFKKMGLYEYFPREEAGQDSEGKRANAKCVRNNERTEEKPEIRFRLVLQELGYGERLGELFVGAPSLVVVKLLLSVAADRDLATMLLHVKCASSYGAMRRNVYIELHRQDPKWEHRAD